MEIIKKAQSRIEKIWGKQSLKDTPYRLMKYTLTQEYEDELLLHNAITGELVKLNSEEQDFLKHLPAAVPSTYASLVQEHFLVPVDYDEKKVIHQIRQILSKLDKDKSIVGYTILPTTYCNARCFYCYECDYEHVHMTEERAHEVVRYITDHCQGKDISILWFGGEPLMGAKIISQITEELTEKGITFHSSMISNGALFNKELVATARDDWNLKRIQITIDGTEPVYNQVKDYVNMKGSPYQTVLENIRLLLQADIFVSIRMNLGFHNIEDIRLLIQELSETFAGHKNISMYVHELFEGAGIDPRTYTTEERNYLIDLVTSLNDEIAQKGMYFSHKHLPSLSTVHCMADNDHSVIIQPGGELTKCEHSPALEHFGMINSEEYNRDLLNQWKTHAIPSTCEECPLYPSCIWPESCPETGQCQGGKQLHKLKEAREAMLHAAKHPKEKEEQDKDSRSNAANHQEEPMEQAQEAILDAAKH